MHVTGLTLVQLEVADSRASGGTRDERRNAVIPLGSRLHTLLAPLLRSCCTRLAATVAAVRQLVRRHVHVG